MYKHLSILIFCFWILCTELLNTLNSALQYLAVPRPLRLERILSVISCIGVGNLVLTGASKVQNDYFGSYFIN